MITVLLVFAGTLLLLHLFQIHGAPGPTWLGLPRSFVKVNLAIFAAAASATERLLAGTSMDVVYAAFLVVALADAFWAGFLARAERRGR